jgi:hypothetical protein
MRCSSLPLVRQCPAAAVPPALAIESADTAARVGSAVHDCLAWHLRGEDWHAAAAAAYYGVADQVEEVQALTLAGVACWELLAEQFPGPRAVEKELAAPLGDGTLTGRPDLLATGFRGDVRIADWKTGRLDEDAEEQLRGYAYLALVHHPDAVTARACRVGVRARTADWYEWSRSELDAWFAGLVQRAGDQNTYRPGAHCRYCPRALECPARGVLVRETINALLVSDEAGEPQLGDGDGADLARALDACRLVEKICQDIREQARVRVALAGGVLPTGDGRELVLTTQERREIAVTPDSLDLVAAECASHPDYLKTLRFAKSAVEDAVRAAAPRGQKKTAVEQLLRRLDEAGALITQTVERLECRRAVPLVEQQHAAAATSAG